MNKAEGPGALSNVWLNEQCCSIDSFKQQLEVSKSAVDLIYADEVLGGIPLYQAEHLQQTLGSYELHLACMAEWAQVFAAGAGIICIKGAYADLVLLDDVSDTLSQIITKERQTASGTGDHFAAAGANDRLWNAHEKLCMAAPDQYIRYNSNPFVPAVSQAWLGPSFQLTTQVNIVHPGGEAQVCHRDYHMGFQSADILQQYPAHIHTLSASLTLQGAVAHSDMPIEAGPTKLLPGSQSYVPGYLAVHLPEFRDYFEANYIQLPLQKGDALFFNPAVFHAAGENRTSDVHRFANLMQIGSGYARSIETVDRLRMCSKLYPHLLRLKNTGQLSHSELENVLAATAEGYPFPTNLDNDSPLGGMVPQSQLELMHQALNESWQEENVAEALQRQLRYKNSH